MLVKFAAVLGSLVDGCEVLELFFLSKLILDGKHLDCRLGLECQRLLDAEVVLLDRLIILLRRRIEGHLPAKCQILLRVWVLVGKRLVLEVDFSGGRQARRSLGVESGDHAVRVLELLFVGRMGLQVLARVRALNAIDTEHLAHDALLRCSLGSSDCLLELVPLRLAARAREGLFLVLEVLLA